MTRGRGGGRVRAPLARDVQLSKKLSKLLRHDAEQEGLKLSKGGYINLADVLNNRNIKSLNPRTSLSEIQSIVTTNEKQRFSLIHISALDSMKDNSTETTAEAMPMENMAAHTTNKITEVHEDDCDPSHYLIRANQGHSIRLESNDLLTPITIASGNLPNFVVHGTRHEYWLKILASAGLQPMGRNHIHFATGVPDSLRSPASKEEAVKNESEVDNLVEDELMPTVLSGMRNSSTILIFINLKLALEQGVSFWMSENGVVLSEGDEHGVVGLQFFERVEERGGRILVENGVVVAEPEQRHRRHGSGRGAGRGRGGRGEGSRGAKRQGRDIVLEDNQNT